MFEIGGEDHEGASGRHMTLKFILFLHLLLFPCACLGEVFVLGSSYSWDAGPPLLEESNLWHIDCGKTLLYIWSNPLVPCLSTSTPWSDALARHQYDYISFQPVPDFVSSTLATDVATISGWMAMQPHAIGVIHPTWGSPAVLHTLFHDPNTDQSFTNYSRDYSYRLIDELRRANPGRSFLTDRGNEMLDAIYHDIEEGRRPPVDFSELFRDDTGHLSLVGSYLMHNALRQAFGQELGAHAAAFGIDPEKQVYLDAVVRAFAPEQCSDGRDNDEDGYVDLVDPQCFDLSTDMLIGDGKLVAGSCKKREDSSSVSVTFTLNENGTWILVSGSSTYTGTSTTNGNATRLTFDIPSLNLLRMGLDDAVSTLCNETVIHSSISIKNATLTVSKKSKNAKLRIQVNGDTSAGKHDGESLRLEGTVN